MLRKHAYDNAVRFIKMYHDGGGRLLAGTDCSSWAIPRITMQHEFDIFIHEVELTPTEAIVTATRSPADAWRVLDQQGTIEAGKLADLFVVNADPPQDIRNLKQIEWVIQDGEVVNHGYHAWFDSELKFAYSSTDDFVTALKERTEKAIRHRAGVLDVGPAWSFGAPLPGMESVSPRIVTEGDATFTPTLKAVGFMKKSVVYVGDLPLPKEFLDDYELRATVDESRIRAAGMFDITVANKDPFAAQPHWGGTTSLPKPLLVNFKYDQKLKRLAQEREFLSQALFRVSF